MSANYAVPATSGTAQARTVLGIKDRDGAHAEFLTLPSRNLLEIPENVSDDEAVFAEPLAAAFGITEQVPITPGTKVAVIGNKGPFRHLVRAKLGRIFA